MDTRPDSDEPSRPLLSPAAGIVIMIALIFCAALLMSDPEAHVLAALVLLPLLLCPLLHLFMHRGHRRHSHAKVAFEKK